MLRYRIHEHGGPEVLRLEEAPPPRPAPGEVRVRVAAVGLNHLDLWVRRGVPGHRFPLPLVPGSDAAGVVEAVGEGVDPAWVGRAVALQPHDACRRCPACHAGRQNLCRAYRIRGESFDGTCAEAVLAPADLLLPLPPHLAPREAAALPLALLTAWHMLVERARVRPGETVLVLGGASGVGCAAIQVARLLGARVLATAGAPEGRALARELGAEHALPHRDGAPFHEEVRRLTGGLGADVVIEHPGAATWARSLRSLRRGGRLVTCGATTGAEAAVDLRSLFFKQWSLLGSTMGTFADMRRAWRQVEAGAIRPVVAAAFPFGELHAAHGRLERGGVLGKVVVTLDR